MLRETIVDIITGVIIMIAVFCAIGAGLWLSVSTYRFLDWLAK